MQLGPFSSEFDQKLAEEHVSTPSSSDNIVLSIHGHEHSYSNEFRCNDSLDKYYMDQSEFDIICSHLH